MAITYLGFWGCFGFVLGYYEFRYNMDFAAGFFLPFILYKTFRIWYQWNRKTVWCKMGESAKW